MSQYNRCERCQTTLGWKDGPSPGVCVCDDYVNVNGGHTCETCDSLIKGCKRCEQSESPGDGLFAEIGYDPNYSNGFGKFVRCVDCGENMVFDEFSNQCKSCDQVNSGCQTCSDNG